jgi:hypothetical protein
VRTIRTLNLVAITMIAVIILSAGCSTSHKKSASTTTVPAAVTAGEDLQALIIPAPVGFSVDSTPGATGAFTPQLFSSYGGLENAAKAGFVAGYVQSYIDAYSPDGVSVTLIKFATANDASDYFANTAHQTLNFAGATYAPLPVIPGAISVVGTKKYAGEWSHGVVFATGPYYVLVVYANADPGAPPLQLTIWAKTQWLKLH